MNITQDKIDQVNRLREHGETVIRACKRVGVKWPAYYAAKKKLASSSPIEDAAELGRLRKLVCIQAGIIKAHLGIRVEVAP